MRKKLGLIFLTVFVLSALLVGCQDKHDTRQYVETIGFVLTNEVDSIINEMYVYPNEDGTVDEFTEEMGEDLVKNTKKERRVGSFGVTLEVYQGYNILVRDRDGGVYHFENVHLQDADHGILTFDSTQNIPNLELRHWEGDTENITGRYVPPDDAPDHTQNPLRATVNYSLKITNDTDTALTLITMREADDPNKGEVELHIEPLEAGKSATSTGQLYKEDQEVTSWNLYIETQDGEAFDFQEPFDPWSQQTITITGSNGNYSYTAA